ncbi:MAG: end-binding protein Ku [Actinomycetota bacterium]|nr:end-binding protein Ku [Actinomycetota bacterium]
MARAIWSGSISFGLVSVPVKAYAAVRDHNVHFNQLEKGTGARIRYQKVSDKTGKEVSGDDIESGYEVSSGKYVVVDTEEIQDLRPRTTRTIDVTDFVDLDEIDPVYYERTYWLAPAGEAAERPYRLLLAAMEAEKKAGIGTVVMRTKQYLAAIRPLDGALAMSTMRFADEVVPQSEIDALPRKGAKPDAKELKLAAQIIGSLATDWDPKRYHDTYTEELKDLIGAKAKGKKITVEEPAPTEGKVVDLMQALEASLAAARKGGGSKLSAEVAKAAEKLADEAGEEAGEAADEDDSDAGDKRSAPKKPAARKAAAKKPAAKKPAAKKPTRKSA